jgi:hypothetical protein
MRNNFWTGLTRLGKTEIRQEQHEGHEEGGEIFWIGLI